MTRGRLIFRAAWLLIFVCATVQAAVPAATQSSVDFAREQLALRYADPDAHMALARAFHDRGELRSAFLICENARTMFGGETFILSFRDTFQSLDIPLAHATVEVLKVALDYDQKNVKLMKQIAQLQFNHNHFDRAAGYYRKAYALDKGDYSIVQGLADAQVAMGNDSDAQHLLADWADAHPATAQATEFRIRGELTRSPQDPLNLLDPAVAKFPASSALHVMRGRCLLAANRDDEAEADFLAAVAAEPGSMEAQSAAARFYMKTRTDETKALAFYYNVYFLDPDFTDWDRVDRRIESIENLATAKTTVADLTNANPFLAAAGLSQLGLHWDNNAIDRLLPLLDSDVPNLRLSAIDLLAEHASAAGLKPFESMLTATDPWRRAAAVSVVAHVLHDECVSRLSPLMKDPTQLVRYATYVALLQDANKPGRDAVQEGVRDEADEVLKKSIANFSGIKP